MNSPLDSANPGLVASSVFRSRALGWGALLALMVLGFPAANASESKEVVQPHVRVTLISDRDSIAPGEVARVGLRFRLDPNWHVYWKNPGDTGLAPRFETTGADAEWLYPVPERVSLGERFVNFGYRDEVVIPAQVRAADSFFGGGGLELGVRARFLVCEKQCIPARAELALSIPSAASSSKSRESVLIDRWTNRLPRAWPADWSAEWEARKDSVVLRVEAPKGALPSEVAFLPEPQKWLVHGASQHVERRSAREGREEIRLQLALDPEANLGLSEASGLLVDARSGTAWELASRGAAPSSQDAPQTVTLPWALALAFLGGMILNLMPCVFPVLWLKLFGLARQSSRSRTASLVEGAAYSAGVVLSFVLLAGLLIALRNTGERLGWGFQLQSPVFVTGLVLLFLFLGFQMLGMIEVGSALGALGGEGLVRLTRAGSETAASFWTGALAVVVATPCTAPFMGAALGYAIAQPAPEALLVFASLGVGMAAPFLVVSAFPRALARVLPRPGRWMEVLKQAMAFPLFATAVWLLWVLSLQGEGGVLLVPALGGVLGVSGAGFLFHRFRQSAPGRRISVGLLGISVIASLWSVHHSGAIPGAIPSGSAHRSEGLWKDWSEAAVGESLSAGRPVFVDFTAAWCVTCQVNERIAFSSSRVQALFRDKNVVMLKGDWTNEDARITNELERRGRSGVPLYLLFDPRSPESPRVLPQLLTEEIIMEELRQLP